MSPFLWATSKSRERNNYFWAANTAERWISLEKHPLLPREPGLTQSRKMQKDSEAQREEFPQMTSATPCGPWGSEQELGQAHKPPWVLKLSHLSFPLSRATFKGGWKAEEQHQSHPPVRQGVQEAGAVWAVLQDVHETQQSHHSKTTTAKQNHPHPDCDHAARTFSSDCPDWELRGPTDKSEWEMLPTPFPPLWKPSSHTYGDPWLSTQREVAEGWTEPCSSSV